jgi:hypothetical protein
MSGTEGILNRPQMAEVDEALAVTKARGLGRYAGLDDLWRSGMRHYAGGGQIVPVPGFPGERAASRVIPMIEKIAHTYGLTLTDAYGPGHQSPGHTRYGTAADFAGPDARMDAAVRALVRAGYLVGYDGRFGSQAWPGHGPSTVAGSNAHLHVELGSGGGGLVSEVSPVRIVGPPSALRRVAQAAADRMTGAANRYLSTVGPVPVGGGGGGAMSIAEARRVAAQALRMTGHYSPANVAGLVRMGQQESGLRPGIVQQIHDVNSGGNEARGWLQVTPGTFRAYALPGHGNILSPLDNALASIRYQFARYGRIVGHAGYRLGGLLRRLPGFNGGGNVSSGSGSVRAGHGTAHNGIQGFNLRTAKGRVRHRVDAYEDLQGRVETLRNDYALEERRYNRIDDDQLVDDQGNLNQRLIDRKTARLDAMRTIAKKIEDTLSTARAVARRTRDAYRTLAGRITNALRHARRKDRAGLRQQLRDARGGAQEYGQAYGDLFYDVANAHLDWRDLGGELKAMRGSIADQQDQARQAASDAATGGGQDPDLQAIADQATRAREAAEAQVAALRANLAAFSSPGDIGAFRAGQAPSAFAAAAAGTAGPVGAGPVAGGFAGAAPEYHITLAYTGWPMTHEQVQMVGKGMVSAIDQMPTRPSTVERVG